MSNKIRNIQAVRIFRPVATGQVRGANADFEAAVIGIIYALFRIELLPPMRSDAMWSRP